MDKKKKFPWGQVLMLGVFVLIGAACGILMVEVVSRGEAAGRSLGGDVFSLALLFVWMYAAMLVQIVLHEAGHLVFGLLTGYRFASFRVGSFMWVKKDGKLQFKRFSLAGTGGQCLMDPPDMVSGRIPYVLYNLGGSLMNLLTSALFLGLYFLCRPWPMLSAGILMLVIVGVAFALINGIPLRLGAVDNDGYNALSLGKDTAALRSFWIQMKTNTAQIYGLRLRDMPEEWFALPTDAQMQNSMLAVLGVFACNRLMDQHRFREAEALMSSCMTRKTGIIGLHKNMLCCDLLFCELIGENRPEMVDALLTKEQRKFMKSMKNYLSVLRTEYALALLREKDAARAEELRRRFEKAAGSYPYPGDAESERELMETAKEYAI